MNTTLLRESSLERSQWIHQALGNWTRKVALSKLRHLKVGCLEIQDDWGTETLGSPGGELRVGLRVSSPNFYSSLVLGGTIGAAESYIRGEWTCNDLTLLTRIITRNRETLNDLESGLARLAEPGRKLLHRLHKNTIRGSRKNIEAHYDLSNDFYRLFLDSSLTYSCGIFETTDSTLEEASTAKLDRICRKLRLSPGDRVLEIGTGWGSFAMYAARNYGCHVTTTTISANQHDLAWRRIQEAGLEDRIELLFRDYRDLKGCFDKLVSIEMIEAVGHHYFEDFFSRCSSLLTERGSMLLQAITMADWNYEAARDSVDFIKKYIFPGSCIPSVSALLEAAAKASDLKVFHLEDITPHYARTLREWRHQFLDNSDAVKDLGFSEEFMRMWEFYLCYCEGGFAERFIGDVQMLFTKPQFRGEPILGEVDPGSH